MKKSIFRYRPFGPCVRVRVSFHRIFLPLSSNKIKITAMARRSERVSRHLFNFLFCSRLLLFVSWFFHYLFLSYNFRSIGISSRLLRQKIWRPVDRCPPPASCGKCGGEVTSFIGNNGYFGDREAAKATKNGGYFHPELFLLVFSLFHVWWAKTKKGDSGRYCMLITFIFIYSLGETMLSALFLLAFVIFVFVFKDKIGGESCL